MLKHRLCALRRDVGCGKSRQVVDAACELYRQGKINTVIIVCPASVRTVWCDEEIGEIKKFTSVGSRVTEFSLGKIKMRWCNSE